MRKNDPANNTKQTINIISQNEGSEGLFLAIRNCNVQLVKQLLDSGENPNQWNNTGDKALHIAAKQDNIDIVNLLLLHGADPNSVDSYGSLPLHISVERNNAALATLLSNNINDINHVNNRGLSPLKIAINNRSNEIVEMILSKIITNPNNISSIFINDQNWLINCMQCLGYWNFDRKDLGVTVAGVNAILHNDFDRFRYNWMEIQKILCPIADTAKQMIQEPAIESNKAYFVKLNRLFVEYIFKFELFKLFQYEIVKPFLDDIEWLENELFKMTEEGMFPIKNSKKIKYQYLFNCKIPSSMRTYRDIIIADQSYGVYTKNDFQDYLELLEKKFIPLGFPITLILNFRSSLVVIGLNKDNDAGQYKWTYIEANQLPGQSFDQRRDIIDKLFELFSTNEYIMMEFILCVDKKQIKQTMKSIHYIHRHAIWKKIHSVNKIKAKIISPTDMTWLFLSIKHGDLSNVISLLDNGADPNDLSTTKFTPLAAAVCYEHKDMVTVLLQYGASVNKNQEYKLSPLAIAVLRNSEEIATILFNHGADVDMSDGYTPLQIASDNGYVNFVELLLKHNAYPDQYNGGSHPPLFYAVKSGHAEIANKLLLFGADPHYEAKNGMNLLYIAAEKNYKVIVEKLLTYGANPNTLIEKAMPLLLYACKNKKLWLVSLLLKHKAQVNLKHRNDSALSIAIKNRNYKLLDILFSYGVDINQMLSLYLFSHPDGGIAIYYATEREDLKLIRYLLIHKANPNIICFGESPLIKAITLSNIKIIKLLLSFGADPNQPNNKNITPLSTADIGKDLSIVKVLLKHGAIVDESRN